MKTKLPPMPVGGGTRQVNSLAWLSEHSEKQ